MRMTIKKLKAIVSERPELCLSVTEGRGNRVVGHGTWTNVDLSLNGEWLCGGTMPDSPLREIVAEMNGDLEREGLAPLWTA